MRLLLGELLTDLKDIPVVSLPARTLSMFHIRMTRSVTKSEYFD